MIGRDEPSDTAVDPDDWFAGSDSEFLDETGERTRTNARADAYTEPDWIEDAAEPYGGSQTPGRRLADNPRARLIVLGAGGVVLLLIILAAAGVFSGGGSPSTSPITTSQTTTPATNTTPTTPTNTTPAVTLPSTVLKPGSTGADVKSLQQALKSAGHSPGAIDGVYGTKTQEAVTAFQQSAGIKADGIYGAQTKQALDSAINNSG